MTRIISAMVALVAVCLLAVGCAGPKSQTRVVQQWTYQVTETPVSATNWTTEVRNVPVQVVSTQYVTQTYAVPQVQHGVVVETNTFAGQTGKVNRDGSRVVQEVTQQVIERPVATTNWVTQTYAVPVQVVSTQQVQQTYAVPVVTHGVLVQTNLIVCPPGTKPCKK